MPRPLRIKGMTIRTRKKKPSPAVIEFTSDTNERGKDQKCVFARCELSDHEVGPIWGHSAASVRRVLATLTTECVCRAKRHKIYNDE